MASLETFDGSGQTTLMLSEAEANEGLPVSKRRTFAIIGCTTCLTGIGNLLAGLLTVCIPVIANDLSIPSTLQLWPAAAFALASGCTLLPLGAAADVLGCRRMCLFGALLQTASAVGAGLSTSIEHLVALRGLAGIAASCCLPGAVGAISRIFQDTHNPRRRNAAFAAMGGGQAIGFGLGLVLGGVCADTVGWRWGFYSSAIMNSLVLALALWALPRDVDEPIGRRMFSRLARDIDWAGAFLICSCLALLSYELSVATGANARQALGKPWNIALLCIAVILLPIFGLWMQRQTKLGRQALIPNTLWTNIPFTTVCVTVFLIWGSLNASEQLTALYLQDILEKSPMTTSLYFLPAPICGMLMNTAVGFLLPFMRPAMAVPASCLVSAIAPLLLALLCNVDGPDYWHGVFQAMALNPLGADLLYTIANLVVTNAFPLKTQALAGGIFNMLAQIGKSVGIAATSLIARRVSKEMANGAPKNAILTGYHAGWWFNFALAMAAALISSRGLRSITRLGVKEE